jgi:hypothetical protein
MTFLFVSFPFDTSQNAENTMTNFCFATALSDSSTLCPTLPTSPCPVPWRPVRPLQAGPLDRCPHLAELHAPLPLLVPVPRQALLVWVQARARARYRLARRGPHAAAARRPGRPARPSAGSRRAGQPRAGPYGGRGQPARARARPGEGTRRGCGWQRCGPRGRTPPPYPPARGSERDG